MIEYRGRRGQKVSACDSCCKRKIKCDGAKPNCFWCQHYKIPCTIQRDGIRHRILQCGDNTIDEKTHESPHNGTNLDKRQLDLAIRADVLQPKFFPLAPFAIPSAVCRVWARFKSGELVSTDRLCRDHFRNRAVSPLTPFSSSMRCTEFHIIETTILPDRALVENYASSYMRSMMRITFPILDPVLFEETMKIAYESNECASIGIVSARACVITFSMFAHLVSVGIQVCSTAKFNEYAALMQRISLIIPQSPTVDGFQTCIFLLLSQFFTGNLQSAAITNSIAARFVFHFGAHDEWPMQPFSQTQDSLEDCTRTHLRNLFWVCYTIDKELCLRNAQPPALSDYYCDTALSLQYLEEVSKKVTIGGSFQRVHPYLMFPTDVKLAQIKSRAYELLYSKAAHRKSNTELLKDVRTLGDSLEIWRLAIPEEDRPKLVFSHYMPTAPSNADIRTLILRLDYLHCVAVINQASNRCLGSKPDFDGTRFVAAMNISQAVESCRSSLRYLKTVYRITTKGSFWLLVFYVFAASVTIYCNILDNPALASALQDYHLLDSVPGLLCDMSTYNLNTEELRHRNELELFVQELIDSARFAISSVSGSTP